jgi:hypothetical protein
MRNTSVSHKFYKTRVFLFFGTQYLPAEGNSPQDGRANILGARGALCEKYKKYLLN